MWRDKSLPLMKDSKNLLIFIFSIHIISSLVTGTTSADKINLKKSKAMEKKN